MRTLKAAGEASAHLGKEYVGSEHLLMGLLEDKTSHAAQLLDQFSTMTERVKALWDRTIEREMLCLLRLEPLPNQRMQLPRARAICGSRRALYC